MKQLKDSGFKFDGRSCEFKFKNANGQITDTVIISLGEKIFRRYGEDTQHEEIIA